MPRAPDALRSRQGSRPRRRREEAEPLNAASKRLIVVRHAKSSWKDASLDDFDRPLNSRGHRDAPEMARRMRDRGGSVDAIVSSPARRAWDTALVFARELAFDPRGVVAEPAIYGASLETLLATIWALDDAWDTVLFVGHNPGLSELVSELTREPRDLATCAVAELEIPAEAWAQAGRRSTRLALLDTPKEPAQRARTAG